MRPKKARRFEMRAVRQATMRILLTNTGPWGTGSAMVAESVLAELRRKGHEAMLFFPDAQVAAPGKDHY